MKGNHENEIEKVKMLKKDWKSVDDLAGEPTISEHEIEEQLHLYHVERKNTFRKELTLFMITAIFMLGLFVTVLLNSFQTILYIQLCAALVGPLISIFLTGRERKVNL